ncbi:MAG: SDR family oxidoreductase [Sphingobium sp.]
MHIELNGKTAVVTGSTQGIGLATVKGLAGTGAEVVLNGLTQEAVDRAVEAARAAVPGAKISGVVADLSSAEGCRKLVQAVPTCDILVSNLGIFENQDFFEIPDETWQLYFEVNVMAGVRLARSYLPAMAERKWGRVVFISSECGISTPPEMIHYTMTKTALLGVSRAIAKRMGGTGVTVNAVLPGPTMTEGVKEIFQEETAKSGKSLEELGTEILKTLRPSCITKRFASAEEVANMVVYACSKQASSTSGAALKVDCGVADSPI